MHRWNGLIARGFCVQVAVVALVCSALLLAAPVLAQEASARNQQPPPQDDEGDDGYEDDDEDLLDLSSTGYIDDAVVRTRFRLRFDSATGATRPDRAEFLYGKCDCFAGFGQDAASPGPAKNLDFQELELGYEHAFSRRFSLFAEIPYRWIDLTKPANSGPPEDHSGLGDFRAGLKYALIADRGRYLTFQLRTYFASGDAAKALGTDHASIEPAFLYHHKATDRLGFAAEARWWHPLSGSSDPITGASIPGSDVGRIEFNPFSGTPGPDPAVRNNDFAGDVLRFGVGTSYKLGHSSVLFTPVVELVGWYVVDGYSTPPIDLPANLPADLPNRSVFIEEAANTTIVNLKVGVRISGHGSGSFYLGYGLALTDEDWYDDIIRFEYRIGLSTPKRRATKLAADLAAANAGAEVAAQQRARIEAERAAQEAQAMRAAAERQAREADARKVAAESATREAEARRAQAESEAARQGWAASRYLGLAESGVEGDVNPAG